MSSKIYAKDSCSQLEAEWNGIDTTVLAFNATHFVNPTWDNLVGKTIILTLPTKLNLKKLTRYNKVISRYKLDSDTGEVLKYEFSPYPDVDSKLEVSSNYSRKILNRYLLTSGNTNITDKDRFILGTDPVSNGSINTIGYLLVKTIN